MVEEKVYWLLKLFCIIVKSMALPTDGIYMGAHVLAIGLSWMAYIIVRKVSTSKKLKAIQIKYSTGALLQSVPSTSEL